MDEPDWAAITKTESQLRFIGQGKRVVPFSTVDVDDGEIATENIEEKLARWNSLGMPLILRGSAKGDGVGLVGVLPTSRYNRPVTVDDLCDLIDASREDHVRRYARMWDQIDDYEGLNTITVSVDFLPLIKSMPPGAFFRGSCVQHPNVRGAIIATIYFDAPEQTVVADLLLNSSEISYLAGFKDCGESMDMLQIYLAHFYDTAQDHTPTWSTQREFLLSSTTGDWNERVFDVFEHANDPAVYSSSGAPRIWWTQERRFKKIEYGGGTVKSSAHYGVQPSGNFRKVNAGLKTPEEPFMLRVGSEDCWERNFDGKYLRNPAKLEAIAEQVNSPNLVGIDFLREPGSRNGNLHHGSYRFLVKAPFTTVSTG